MEVKRQVYIVHVHVHVQGFIQDFFPGGGGGGDCMGVVGVGV